ncbi:unnamed protein product, partial [Leptidea sinapis]
MKFMRILLPITICCVAIVGDYIVLKCKYSESFLFRAISDNTVHALIGMLSAMLFMDGIDLTKQAYFYNVAFCTIISSFIDLDHFLVAKSVYIKLYIPKVKHIFTDIYDNNSIYKSPHTGLYKE